MIYPLRFASLGFLLFACWHMIETFSVRPAFNRSLQVEVVTGGKRPLMQKSMYSDAEYLFQIAYGYQNSIAAPLLLEGVDAMPSAEVVAENSHKARSYATESLRISPGNPMAWLVLASADLSWGAPAEEIVSALQKSYATAPHNSEVAALRLHTAILLAYAASLENMYYPKELDATIKADASLLKLVSPREFSTVYKFPFAKPIIDKAMKM